MATIKVDTAKLRSTAAQFQSTGKQIRSLTNNMTSTVHALSGQIWTGDAATKYKTQFDKLQDDIMRMIKMIDEHVADLQDMAAQYESAEAASESAAAALSGDVIV